MGAGEEKKESVCCGHAQNSMQKTKARTFHTRAPPATAARTPPAMARPFFSSAVSFLPVTAFLALASVPVTASAAFLAPVPAASPAVLTAPAAAEPTVLTPSATVEPTVLTPSATVEPADLMASVVLPTRESAALPADEAARSVVCVCVGWWWWW